MNTKPTYKELEQKIKLLEKKIIEIEGNKKAIKRSVSIIISFFIILYIMHQIQ